MDRRTFLQLSGGSAIAAAATHPPAIAQTDTPLLIEAWSADGIPLDTDILRRLYFLDLEDDPLFNPPRQLETG